MIDRLLIVPIVTPTSPQWGLRNALNALANQSAEFSWYPFWPARVRLMRDEFLAVVAKFNPTHSFFQIQTEGVFPPAILEKVPGFKCEWVGDCRNTTSEHYLKRAKQMDVTMFSNMRDVNNVRSTGRPAEYLQIGIDPDRFTNIGPMRDGTPEIVAMLNNYPDRFPRSRLRAEMVAALRGRYGTRFAVYGNGWGPKDPWLSEEWEAAAYRTCRIAVSCEHYHISGFCSDRALRATGSGACLLSDRFPGFDDHFKDGIEAIAWDDFPDMFRKIDHMLDYEKERKSIAAAGQRRAHKTHSWHARMIDLQAIIDKYSPVHA